MKAPAFPRGEWWRYPTKPLPVSVIGPAVGQRLHDVSASQSKCHTVSKMSTLFKKKKKKIWNGSFIEWRRTSHIGIIFILTYIYVAVFNEAFPLTGNGRRVCESCSLLPYSCGSLTFQILWSDQNRKYQLVPTVFPPFFWAYCLFLWKLKVWAVYAKLD